MMKGQPIKRYRDDPDPEWGCWREGEPEYKITTYGKGGVMPGEYAVSVTAHWWVMPLLKLIRRFGFTFNGTFGPGMASAGLGVNGNPSIEVTYYPDQEEAP